MKSEQKRELREAIDSENRRRGHAASVAVRQVIKESEELRKFYSVADIERRVLGLPIQNKDVEELVAMRNSLPHGPERQMVKAHLFMALYGGNKIPNYRKEKAVNVIKHDVVITGKSDVKGFLMNIDVDSGSLEESEIPAMAYGVESVVSGVAVLSPIAGKIEVADDHTLLAIIPVHDNRIFILNVSDLVIEKIYRSDDPSKFREQIYPEPPEPKQYVRKGRGMTVYEVLRTEGKRARCKSVVNGNEYWIDRSEAVKHVQPETGCGLEKDYWMIPKK